MYKIIFHHKILFACALYLMLPLTAWAEINPWYGTATITAPANLGTIDLAFNLDTSCTAQQHDGCYIMLDKTLLFPAVPPDSKTTGPRVTWTAGPASFSLATDDFTSTVSGKTVTRKVTLVGDTFTNNGNSVSGTYTETISGLTPEVVTVTGSFILVKPTVQTIVVALKDLNMDGCIDIGEIRSAGASQNSIEYSDMSQALHLYYNPEPGLTVCSQQAIKDALTEFYATQKQQ